MAFIAANYGFLNDAITKLQTKVLLLTQQIDLIENTKSKLMEVTGEQANRIKMKTENVFSNNKNFATVQKIASILGGTTLRLI